MTKRQRTLVAVIVAFGCTATGLIVLFGIGLRYYPTFHQNWVEEQVHETLNEIAAGETPRFSTSISDENMAKIEEALMADIQGPFEIEYGTTFVPFWAYTVRDANGNNFVLEVEELGFWPIDRRRPRVHRFEKY